MEKIDNDIDIKIDKESRVRDLTFTCVNSIDATETCRPTHLRSIWETDTQTLDKFEKAILNHQFGFIKMAEVVSHICANTSQTETPSRKHIVADN